MSLSELLNLNPWDDDDRSKYDDSAVIEQVRRNPNDAKRTYEFSRYFYNRCYPLKMAVMLGCSLEAAEALYKANPHSIKHTDSGGYTVLHGACSYNRSLEVATFLVEKNPSLVEMKSNSGWTPLHVACYNGAPLEVVGMLLERYPPALHIESNYGNTPLMHAKKYASPEVISLLEKAEAAAASSSSLSVHSSPVIVSAADVSSSMTSSENRLENVGTQKRSLKASSSPADVFSLPKDLIHQKGGFEGALAAARESNRWLLINIQQASHSSSQALNRDVWEDETAQNLIREKFIFWQTTNVSQDGQTYVERFYVEAYPHLAIMDPHKQSLMWRGEGWTQNKPMTARMFVNVANAFCSRHPNKESPLEKPATDMETNEADERKPAAEGQSSTKLSIPKSICINTKQLKLGARIGKGASAHVFEGTYSRRDGNIEPVAFKQFNIEQSDLSEHDTRSIERELDVLRSFRMHENVVTLLGACSDSEASDANQRGVGFGVMLELANLGSLRKFLLDSKLGTEPRAAQSILLDIAQGMLALHSHRPHPIIHRDLKSMNVLLFSKPSEAGVVAKISDFGLARAVTDSSAAATTEGVGTVRWMAPETYLEENCTVKSDVWSFGMVIYEVATCRIPYDGVRPNQLLRKMDKKELPDMSKVRPSFPDSMLTLMKKCCNFEAKERPRFGAIVECLSDFLGVEKTAFYSVQGCSVEERLEMQRILHELKAKLAEQAVEDAELGADESSVVERVRECDSTVASVSWKDKAIGDKGAGSLASALVGNSNVKELRLENARIRDKGVSSLAAVLCTNSSITKICLKQNNMTDTGAAALGEAIGKNSSVKILKLSANMFGREGATAIAKALHKNSTLEEVDLSKNVIGEGAREFASSLSNNSSLKCLMLDNCGVGTEGTKEIAKALRHNQTLTKLYLRENNVQNDGAEVFINTLQFNEALTRIDLSGNEIESELLVRIEDLLQRNKDRVAKPWTQEQRNHICFLFSDPLVWRGKDDRFHPIPEKLKLQEERSMLTGCIKESQKDIKISFDVATSDRLQAIAVARSGCLHFSGHGLPENFGQLLFEDGRGGAHFLARDELSGLLRHHPECFKVVFVSACHSLPIGQAFIDAGVSHAVCCEQESQLGDDAAIKFAGAFYGALVKGSSVRAAFDSGRGAVSSWCKLEEAQKFILLPADQDHDVPVFCAHPKEYKETENLERSLSIPAAPVHFTGREYDMHTILNELLSERLVTLVGPQGIGLSSLTIAVCHYVKDRLQTIPKIEFVVFVDRDRTVSGFHESLLVPLFKRLVAQGKAQNAPGKELTEDCVLDALKGMGCLVVFDDIRGLEDTMHGFLQRLFKKVQNMTVLLVAGQQIGYESLHAREAVVDVGPWS